MDFIVILVNSPLLHPWVLIIKGMRICSSPYIPYSGPQAMSRRYTVINSRKQSK